MAAQRRIMSFTFVLIVGALGLWAAKGHHSVPPGETCRYSFQCAPAEGYDAPICADERCATPCGSGCPPGTHCDADLCR